MIILSFFIIHILSELKNGSTFMGKWKRISSAGTFIDKSFMSFSLFFYRYINHKTNINMSYINRIDSTYHNITDIFNKDDTLGVLGSFRFDNSTYTNFGENHIPCIGVFRKNTFDIIMVCPLRNLLLNSSKFNINNINNTNISPEFNLFKSKISFLFGKIENLFKSFKYDEIVNNITQKNFEEFKFNILYKNSKYNNFKEMPHHHNNINNVNKTDFDRNDKLYKLIEKQIVIKELKYYKMQLYNLSEYRSHFILDFNIGSNLSLQYNYFINRRIYFSLIYLRVNNSGKIENPFDLNCLVNGLFIPETKKNTLTSVFTIKAQEINAPLFNKEARTFGAISGVFFATLILIYKIMKFQDYHLVSTITALMNTSYDLGYGNFLYLIGKIDESTSYLYSILSLGYGAIFFINTFRIVFKSWASINEARFRDIQPLTQRRYYTAFLFQCNAFYITSLLTFTNISENSQIVMFILFSNWIPQIIFNATRGCRNSIPKTYYIGVTYIRLFEMAYNFLCPTNMLLLKSNCQSSFFMAFIWSSLQVLILFLQSKFGGAFFLPKSFKNAPYDYYSQKPPPHTECPICLSEIDTENEVAVITPCHHAFHEGCLRRWIQEQSICPMCRRQLPPISEPEPIP